jgi:hypothetical protein
MNTGTTTNAEGSQSGYEKLKGVVEDARNEAVQRFAAKDERL